MVQTDDFQEVTLSITVSHYLYSSFQGEIAKQRARLALNLTVDQQELEKIESSVEEFVEWAKEATKGNVLFKSEWDRPKTVAAKKAVRYLEWIKSRHLDDVRRIEHLISNFAENVNVENQFKDMLALSVKRIYIVDNFRLFDYLIQGADCPESDTNPLIEITSRMISSFSDYFPPSDLVKNAIREELELSKCHLKVYANDALLKLCLFKPFQFENSIIPPSQAESWRAAGFDPMSASVWYCYDFSTEAALAWISYGFLNPAVCWLWRFMNFQPFEARDWATAGYDPKTARKLADQGKYPEPPQGSNEDTRMSKSNKLENQGSTQEINPQSQDSSSTETSSSKDQQNISPKDEDEV